MESRDQLEAIVADLIDLLQLQAWELEGLINRVEQITKLHPNANNFSVTRSELAALHLRMDKLRVKK
jgi:hypothetical protein